MLALICSCRFVVRTPASPMSVASTNRMSETISATPF